MQNTVILRRFIAVVTLCIGPMGDVASSGSVTLAWDPPVPDSSVAGYRLYYGFASRQYTHSINLDNVTSYTFVDFDLGKTSYFALSTLDTNGILGLLSEEVVVDREAPVVSGFEDLTAYIEPGSYWRLPDLTLMVGASDDVSPRDEIRLSQTPAPRTPINTCTPVTLTAADAAGNTSLWHAVFHLLSNRENDTHEDSNTFNFDVDTDGDGSSDGAEAIAGTDPTDADSRCALQLVHTSSGLALHFTAHNAPYPSGETPHRFYALERTDGLRKNAWAPVPGYERIPADDQPVTHTPTLSNHRGVVYRLRAWVEE